MTSSDLHLSGLVDSTRTDGAANPDNPVSPIRPVRSWTLRMSQALGLPRRRIQKLLIEGAPDATDDAANGDWQALERTWRSWIHGHPRYRSLTRRMRSSTDLDAGAQNAGSAAAGAVPGPGMEGVDPVKHRRCQLLDLEIGEKLGQLVQRNAAKDLLTQTLHLALGRIDELPALLAQQVPPEHRDLLRVAGKRIALAERARFEGDVRRLWKDRMPFLRPVLSSTGI